MFDTGVTLVTTLAEPTTARSATAELPVGWTDNVTLGAPGAGRFCDGGLVIGGGAAPCGLQTDMSSVHVCSNFGSPGLPHCLFQIPPGAQQLSLPDFLITPHLGHKAALRGTEPPGIKSFGNRFSLLVKIRFNAPYKDGSQDCRLNWTCADNATRAPVCQTTNRIFVQMTLHSRLYVIIQVMLMWMTPHSQELALHPLALSPRQEITTSMTPTGSSPATVTKCRVGV